MLIIILRLNSGRNNVPSNLAVTFLRQNWAMAPLLSPRHSPEFPGIPFQEQGYFLLPCLRRKVTKRKISPSPYGSSCYGLFIDVIITLVFLLLFKKLLAMKDMCHILWLKVCTIGIGIVVHKIGGRYPDFLFTPFFFF